MTLTANRTGNPYYGCQMPQHQATQITSMSPSSLPCHLALLMVLLGTDYLVPFAGAHNDTNDGPSRYKTLVARGTCGAQCFQNETNSVFPTPPSNDSVTNTITSSVFGVSSSDIYFNHVDFYRSSRCHTPICRQCLRVVKAYTKLNSCRESCEEGQDSCLKVCECIVDQINQIGYGEGASADDDCSHDLSSSPGSSSLLTEPTLHCRETYGPENRTIYLKWNYADEANEKVVFLLEQRSRERPRWVYLDITELGIAPIRLKKSGEYQWRVTVLSTNGVVAGSCRCSKWIRTLPEHNSPKAVSKITVTDMHLRRHNELTSAIEWKPSEDATCFYEIYIYNDEQYFKLEIVKPEQLFLVVLEGLELGKNYTVNIITKSFDFEKESNKTTIFFHTPTCNQAYNYSLRYCAPPPPRDVQVDICDSTEQQDKAGTRTVTISWEAPILNPPRDDAIKLPYNFTNEVLNTDVVNGIAKDTDITGYVLTLKEIPIAQLLTIPKKQQEFNLSPNITSFDLEDLDVGGQYDVRVKAVSIGGKSVEALVTFRVPEVTFASSADSNSGMTTAAVLTPILVIVLLCGAICCVVTCDRRRRRREALVRYFEGLDKNYTDESEKLNFNSGCHNLPLANSPDYLAPGAILSNQSGDDFEVSYDSLLLSHVIGEGAFGVVKKGQMRCTNRHSLKLWETVAVKMLRESASTEDRTQFIQEIATMKALGRHPHIVNIRGACTLQSPICLIVEHCALGDLQNYLRKEWENMACKEDPRDGETNDFNPKDHRHHGVKRSHHNNRRVKYAQLIQQDSKADDRESKPPERRTSSAIPDVVINKTYDLEEELGETDHEENDDESLSPSDLLSFARQIALGMEFLSCNKVVHRDLAARNVLVCPDKVVKISDFGLSRDVYEQNMYRKTSGGKLPIKWMAYESLLQQIYTTKSDVWSYGVLLWEIVTMGGTPYPGIPSRGVFALLKGGYRMEKPDNCSEQLYAMMRACWRTRPVNRPTFTELRRSIETLLEEEAAATKGGGCSLYLNLDINYESACYMPEKETSSTSGVSSKDDHTAETHVDICIAAQNDSSNDI